MIITALACLLIARAVAAASYSCIDRSTPETCDLSNVQKNEYAKYFNAMKPIYGDLYAQTGLERRKNCGWKQHGASVAYLPTYVLSVGLEGAGHHLYSEIFQEPVFDCVWVSRTIDYHTIRLLSVWFNMIYRSTVGIIRETLQTAYPEVPQQS